jgi:predicted pyridoxine 5'-phosphate oxidase superfamily flavin-nucleotide-binding protein
VTESAFHEGELAMQESAGVRERLAEFGSRVIRDFMPDQHREFFEHLPFIVTGIVDRDGQPWASMRVGEPGFMHTPDAKRLVVGAGALPNDPSAEGFVAGASIGLLGIEPHTRRRNRANGVIARADAGGFEVDVRQSFGNCPKYIQARRAEFAPVSSVGQQPAHRMTTLDEASIAMITNADTFFIATAHPQAHSGSGRSQGVDVSHRGGRPGFVGVEGGLALTVPDFIGNFYFNTLGNLVLNPRCGLLFVDYERGDMLYVAARGEIVTDPAQVSAFAGAQRLLRFAVTSAVRVVGALPLRWTQAELSPALAGTGVWASRTGL